MPEMTDFSRVGVFDEQEIAVYFLKLINGLNFHGNPWVAVEHKRVYRISWLDERRTFRAVWKRIIILWAFREATVSSEI